MKQEFVTLPREAVERAIEALKSDRGMAIAFYLEISALRTALEKPQANQPAMTPIAQRKLDSLLTEGYTISGYSIYHEQKHQHGFVTGAGLVGWWRPEGMEYPQPLGEQEPVAWMVTSEMQDGTRSTYPMIGRFKDVQDCCDFGEPVPLIYQHPQPKRDPLTDEEIDKLCPQFDDPMRREMWIIGFKAAHNIK